MPPKAKPKVAIDQDGDGDYDVTVDVEAPDPDPTPLPSPDLDVIAGLVARMEVILPTGTTRITYSAVRETLRGLLP